MSSNLPARVQPAGVATPRTDLPEWWMLGDVLARSGYFSDARDAAKAAVKVLAGRELGIGPVAAMTGIDIIEGQPSYSANLLAALIKSKRPRYDYTVLELDATHCSIQFWEDGEESGVSTFTIEDAKTAGLVKPGSPWTKYPRNMLFARAMTNGQAWFCPDVTHGVRVYDPEELGRDTAPVVAEPTVRPSPRDAAVQPEINTMPTDGTPSAGGGHTATPAPRPASSGTANPAPPAAGTVMEASHPEHRLHQLWSLLDQLGVEWKSDNWMAAIDVLKKNGIAEADALKRTNTRARALGVLRLAFGVQVEPSGAGQAAVDEVMGDVDFPEDGCVRYPIPSRKERPGTDWVVTLSPDGRHHCPCPARTPDCHHVTEALQQLTTDAESDEALAERFAGVLALETPPEPDPDDEREAAADRAWAASETKEGPGA